MEWWTPEVEILARDLKSLIGWGAKRQHVIRRPILVRVVRELWAPDVEQHLLAPAVIEALKVVAGRLPEPKAESCKCLLMLTRRWDWKSAPTRRAFVICELELDVGVDQMRGADSPELDLMIELAAELLEGPEPAEQMAEAG